MRVCKANVFMIIYVDEPKLYRYVVLSLSMITIKRVVYLRISVFELYTFMCYAWKDLNILHALVIETRRSRSEKFRDSQKFWNVKNKENVVRVVTKFNDFFQK